VSTTVPGELPEVHLDPVDPKICYALADHGIFKSPDSGKSWSLLISGFPGPAVRALVIDPNRRDTLYVGTGNRGVFKSTNGGQNWKPTGSKQLAACGKKWVFLNAGLQKCARGELIK
jgi:hypothetical protein